MSVHAGGRGPGHVSRLVRVGPVAALRLNFLSGTLDSRITFTRSSSATRVNASGVIESVTANTPRFDYDPVTLAPKGLLVEEQRTNLLTYSEQFDNAAWTKTELTVSTNTSTAPDGTATADAVIPTTNTAAHFVTLGVSMTAGVTYALSVYAKASGYRWLRLSFAAAAFPANNRAASFDLQTGTVGQVQSGVTATISDAGNGWYRCTIAATATTTATAANGYTVNDVDSASAASFSGNGTSGIFIYGAQLEAGAFATSYIPTGASQVTRSRDSAAMTGTNFSSWYNATAGTFVVSFTTRLSSVVLVANDGSFNNRLPQMGIGSAAGYENYIISGGSIVASLNPAGTHTFGTTANMAVAYAADNYAAAANGGAVVVDTSGALPTGVNALNIGSFQTGASSMNGHLRSIAYYPTRLSNAQLQALTA